MNSDTPQTAASAQNSSAADGQGAPSGAALAPYIDHTLLAPQASRDEILRLCAEAREHGFFSVCVNPLWVSTVSDALAGSEVATCSVVGFPLGATPSEIKAAEASRALRDGANEIDMVIDIAAARRGDRQALESDIAAVAKVVHEAGALLKVIIETSLLDDDAKVLACTAAAAVGADFVKTSTGFSGGGATVEDVRLMRATVGPTIGVKASGGVRTAQDAQAMILAGATRIGASAGIAIIADQPTDAPEGY